MSTPNFYTTPAQVDGKIASYVSPGKGVRAYSSGTTNFGASGVTQIALDSQSFNDDTAYYVVGSNVITVKKAGLYIITYYAQINLNTANSYSVFPRINGSITIQESGAYVPASTPVRITGTTLNRCAVNDTIGLYVYSPSAGSIIGGANSKEVGVNVAFLGS